MIRSIYIEPRFVVTYLPGLGAVCPLCAERLTLTCRRAFAAAGLNALLEHLGEHEEAGSALPLAYRELITARWGWLQDAEWLQLKCPTCGR